MFLVVRRALMQKLHDWWDRGPIWQPFALVFVVCVIIVVLTHG